MRHLLISTILFLLAYPTHAQHYGHYRSYHSRSSYTYHSPRNYHSTRSYAWHVPRTRSYRSYSTRSYHSSRSYAYRSSGSHRSTYAYGVPRDEYGRIKRSASAREEFMRMTGYPHGRPGYVIDHIKPLKKGGCDCPSNMQWQTRAAAKAKDKWE